ncbi:sensor histidine kinase [Kitasatospora phosalacinea]|uniref:histidine kinase n=1 Tax=Kitasatospora phosalacinea TaxID=2065 RepID=A0A9W6PL29_9ACTN|nr:histidine kinase [Kitasatospora phosalacinea]GLW57021.1 two-component sensor histidine kinase [Kitasatospora phosalacinea]
MAEQLAGTGGTRPPHHPDRGPAAEALLPVLLPALLLLLLLLLLLHVATAYPPGERPVAAALTVALVLPLPWRRRAPRAVFGAVAAAAFVQWLLDVQLPADVALLVALYAVAGYAGRRAVAAAGAVVVGGALLACLRWSAGGAFPVLFVAVTATALAAALLGVNARTARAHLAVLRERAERLEQQQAQQARLAVAEERARIAREVHDIVTHNLSVMVALTDAAVHAQPRSPERATAVMLRAAETGRQALTDMRRSLGVLRAGEPGVEPGVEPGAERHPPPGLDQLAALADRMTAAGLPTRLELRGDRDRVPATAQLTVHRLVQEALTNAFKHTSPGTRAEVRVHCADGAVTVDVTDDGPGATASGRPGRHGGPGHGLPGMRERAAAYGGELRAGPLPGGGWGVHAVLELDAGGAARA